MVLAPAGPKSYRTGCTVIDPEENLVKKLGLAKGKFFGIVSTDTPPSCRFNRNDRRQHRTWRKVENGTVYNVSDAALTVTISTNDDLVPIFNDIGQ